MVARQPVMYKIENLRGQQEGAPPVCSRGSCRPGWAGSGVLSTQDPWGREREQRQGQQDGSWVSPHSGRRPWGRWCPVLAPPARCPTPSAQLRRKATRPAAPWGPVGQAGQTGDTAASVTIAGADTSQTGGAGSRAGEGRTRGLLATGRLRQRSQSRSLSGRAPCCLAASRKASSLASFFWFRASYASLFLMMRWTMRSVVRSFLLST